MSTPSLIGDISSTILVYNRDFEAGKELCANIARLFPADEYNPVSFVTTNYTASACHAQLQHNCHNILNISGVDARRYALQLQKPIVHAILNIVVPRMAKISAKRSASAIFLGRGLLPEDLIQIQSQRLDALIENNALVTLYYQSQTQNQTVCLDLVKNLAFIFDGKSFVQYVSPSLCNLIRPGSKCIMASRRCVGKTTILHKLESKLSERAGPKHTHFIVSGRDNLDDLVISLRHENVILVDDYLGDESTTRWITDSCCTTVYAAQKLCQFSLRVRLSADFALVHNYDNDCINEFLVRNFPFLIKYGRLAHGWLIVDCVNERCYTYNADTDVVTLIQTTKPIEPVGPSNSLVEPTIPTTTVTLWKHINDQAVGRLTETTSDSKMCECGRISSDGSFVADSFNDNAKGDADTTDPNTWPQLTAPTNSPCSITPTMVEPNVPSLSIITETNMYESEPDTTTTQSSQEFSLPLRDNTGTVVGRFKFTGHVKLYQAGHLDDANVFHADGEWTNRSPIQQSKGICKRSEGLWSYFFGTTN